MRIFVTSEDIFRGSVDNREVEEGSILNPFPWGRDLSIIYLNLKDFKQ